MTFEQSMERLDEIAELLESGSAGLDGSLKLYKEGADLIKQLNKRIEEAEKSLSEDQNA